MFAYMNIYKNICIHMYIYICISLSIVYIFIGCSNYTPSKVIGNHLFERTVMHRAPISQTAGRITMQPKGFG